MTASGTFGYARKFDHLVDLNRLGGIIVKGLSLDPTKGNPPPRIVETPCGMLNAIGLENVGMIFKFDGFAKSLKTANSLLLCLMISIGYEIKVEEF